MEFYTFSGRKRPVRLSEETRRFAYDSLNHKYGLDTLRVMNVSLAHPDNYSNLSVRVSGWNARFVTMNREWQNMIIERTK